MHPRQAALLNQAEEITGKLAGKEAASPVLWKYVDPDGGGEFFLPSRRQNVHSPYTGKSAPQRPEKYQIPAVQKELQQEQKEQKGSPEDLVQEVLFPTRFLEPAAKTEGHGYPHDK